MFKNNGNKNMDKKLLEHSTESIGHSVFDICFQNRYRTQKSNSTHCLYTFSKETMLLLLTGKQYVNFMLCKNDNLMQQFIIYV